MLDRDGNQSKKADIMVKIYGKVFDFTTKRKVAVGISEKSLTKRDCVKRID